MQDIIKKRRLELELTLKDVAKALGVSEATVSRYESGEIQNMGIDKIESLSSVLRCSPGYLMGWSSETAATISNMDKTFQLTFYNDNSEQEFNKIFSKQLKAQLKLHEMTQSDLAKRLGVSTQSVTNWCKGAKTPRMDKVDSMCKIFNCRRSDLMEEKSSIPFNNNDKTILDKYHLLNDEGKQRLLERADELIELGYVAKGDVLKEA